MKIPYTTDAAYLHYYKSAASGNYDSGFLKDRIRTVGVASATAAVGAVRCLGRIISVITELAKVAIYALASLITLGRTGENTKRLQDHCRLFVLNSAALLAQPLQLAAHTIAIAVGVIHPKTAYHLMQASSTPLTLITSQEKQIWHNYKTPEIYEKLSNILKTKIMSLFSNAHWAVEMAITTLVYEFPHALASGVAAPLGFMEPFRIFNANPVSLTDEQKKLIPILLLNGNYSHQATFLPLLHAFDQSGNKRPIYTINIPPNSVCDTDRVKEKVKSIKELYNKTDDTAFRIDMLGHSMGSGIIQVLSGQKTDFKINRIVTVGAPLSFASKEAFTQAFDVTGKKDLLVWTTSRLDEKHSKEIDTGHLGLLFHPESLQTMQDFLNE